MTLKLPKTINHDEFVSLMKETKENKYKLAFSLGYFCGLRISEVINLTQNHIDYDRKMLFIEQGKGKKDRYVPFPSLISVHLLKKHIPLGVTKRALQYQISHISERLMGRKVKFHAFRHSCATNYLAKGMNIREVQQLLGHSKLDTTMIYTHVNPEDLKQKMEKIWQ